MTTIKTLLCVVTAIGSIASIASAPQARMHIFDIGPLLKAFTTRKQIDNDKQGHIKKDNTEECVAIKFPSFASICKCPMHKLKHSSYKKAQ